MTPHSLILQLQNQYPMLQHFSDRSFGVEIEFFGLDYLMTPLDEGIVKLYNVKSRSKDGRFIDQLATDHNITLGSTRKTWHFENDSSIQGMGGAEFISPVLHGIKGLIEVYEAFQLLHDLEAMKINKSCGFHVHHGVNQEVYGDKELKKLVQIVYPMEEYFYLLIPGDRKNAPTCRPMELDVDSLLNSSSKGKGSNLEIKKLWYSPRNQFDLDAARDPRYDKTRYHGLNLHSYWYRSTIEFRYHSAVLHEVSEAIEWIVFTQFLVELSHGYVPTIYFYPGANKWMQAIYKIYLAFGYLDHIQNLPEEQK